MKKLIDWEWIKNLFQKLVDLFKGREDNYADDNNLLAGTAESDEEKEAIAQLCEEIDETNKALDEVVEAAKNGKDEVTWLNEELKAMDESLKQEDMEEFYANEAEKEAEKVNDLCEEEANEVNEGKEEQK